MKHLRRGGGALCCAVQRSLGRSAPSELLTMAPARSLFHTPQLYKYTYHNNEFILAQKRRAMRAAVAICLRVPNGVLGGQRPTATVSHTASQPDTWAVKRSHSQISQSHGPVIELVQSDTLDNNRHDACGLHLSVIQYNTIQYTQLVKSNTHSQPSHSFTHSHSQ